MTHAPAAPDWDARYAATDGALFGDAPSDYLRAALARPEIPADGAALCLADGDGRNGTWLAARGWRVTAVDISAEGTRRAAARDRAAGVRTDRIAADVMAWEADPGAFDLATVIYLQGPAPLRRRGAEVAARAVAPGGWLLVEGFGDDGAPAPHGPGPKAQAQRWRLAETEAWARDARPDLVTVEALEGRIRLDEGSMHQGHARVIRLLMRRPA